MIKQHHHPHEVKSRSIYSGGERSQDIQDSAKCVVKEDEARLKCYLYAVVGVMCGVFSAKPTSSDRDVFWFLLADGISKMAFNCVYLPRFPDEAKKNPAVGISRALDIIVNFII